MKEIIDLLKKYTDGKKNTEKVEVSVLNLNRIIKALELTNVPVTNVGDLISRQEAEALFRNARKELMEKDRKEHIKDFNTRELMLLNAEQLIHLLPSVTPERPQNPERNRPESIKYCEECDHIEMCSWYPTDGCEWLKTDRYNAGYNAAKEEIALSGEYERAYQRGFEAGRKSEWTAVAEGEEGSDGR